MTFGLPVSPYEVDPEIVKILDMLFILHADHEQNCSTSTVRLVGSSQANLFSSVSAGGGALFRPLHRGAHPTLLEKLHGVHQSGGGVAGFLPPGEDQGPRLQAMGFGHRVYHNYDPRAAVVKKATRQVLERLGKPDPLLDIAMKLEEVALADDYFVERKLYPNVDFYTGVIYKALGFPTNAFTVLFAIRRPPGWIAQWREMMNDPAPQIGRARPGYIREPGRHSPE